MKPFYTGPSQSAELLVVMLEKHGLKASMSFVDPPDTDDPDDLNRRAEVVVEEADYAEAHRLFYSEREDEL